MVSLAIGLYNSLYYRTCRDTIVCTVCGMLRAMCELLITVKSDHLAIIAFTGSWPKDINKKRTFYNIARVLQTNMLFFGISL